jgi:hypothetical protein
MLFSKHILPHEIDSVNQPQNLFVEDISNLPEYIKNYLNPTLLTHIKQLSGCCVYGYLREHDDEYGPSGSLYYIGEGRSNRPSEKHNNVKTPDPSLIVIFSDNITKDTATNYEIILINHYGRIDIHTGILMNKTSGANNWGPLGKVYETTQCKFCGEHFAKNSAILLHEMFCINNPNKKIHKYAGKKFTKAPCKYCNKLFSIGNGIVFHETYYCTHNPNKKPPLVKSKPAIVSCKFCSSNIATNNIKAHESRCLHNPNKIANPLTGKLIEKESCPFCHQLFGQGTGITRHVKSCKENPKRITRKYKKLK